MLQGVYKFKKRYYTIIIENSAEDNPSSPILHVGVMSCILCDHSNVVGGVY